MEGRVLVCEPPNAFAWTWPSWTAGETVVRFDLEPDGDGCWLTLTHSGLSPPAGRAPASAPAGTPTWRPSPDAIEGVKTPWATRPSARTR